ncbi:MAG: hypothetical protein AAB706_00645 [Patescibacteria group bacterium]
MNKRTGFMIKSLVWILILALLGVGTIFLLSGNDGNDEDREEGQSCSSDGFLDSNCKEGLLCNIGSSGIQGVCNTIQQCIDSGSTADAIKGSEVCFRGV